MGDEITCMCGRPKWTAPDLKRWEDESRECKDPRTFNPDWAKAICWYVGPNKCPMKPVCPRCKQYFSGDHLCAANHEEHCDIRTSRDGWDASCSCKRGHP